MDEDKASGGDDTNVRQKPIKCLELFAGVGGFRYALRDVITDSLSVRAIDINPVTNSIYKFNFSFDDLRNHNIRALTSLDYDDYNADIWAMSPPCQPFTRRGLQLDIDDPRSNALRNIGNSLLGMKYPPRYLILENVCGFEKSKACSIFIDSLLSLTYKIEEYILSPSDIGIPNSRPRYYLLAKYQSSGLSFRGEILTTLPKNFNVSEGSKLIGDYLCMDDHVDEIDIAKKVNFVNAMKLVTAKSSNSSCFTKAYSRYISGSGSLLVWSKEQQLPDISCEELRNLLAEEAKKPKENRRLHLRYFTWREVANLLGFPSDFQKPTDVNEKQMYRALGNSINVKIVKLLITRLLHL